MSIAEEITGKFVIMRNVTESDAKFILSLRCDEKKNKYIHAVDKDIDREIKWIKNQQMKYGDYFYTIVNHRGKLIGNISLYNLNQEKMEAELGRWVSDGAAIENLESIVILHEFAFNRLELKRVYTKTLQDNKQVVSFWKRFGGRGQDNYHSDGKLFYYNVVSNNEWIKMKRKFSAILGGDNNG